jgi:hypothetical protein
VATEPQRTPVERTPVGGDGFITWSAQLGRMYAVVGCTDCGGLWLLADPGTAETATCPRCGRQHRTRRLKRLHTAADREAAREARTAMLAADAGAADAVESVPSLAEMDATDPVVDDREYLEAAGVDADAAAEAAEPSSSSTASRPEVVRDAIRTVDDPDADDIVAYATDRGVPADAASDLLNRLVRRGEATESGGTYRLL